MSETQTQAQPKVKVTVSEIQKMLAGGQDRKAIGEKYGLSRTQLIELFKHPKLKGLKVHRAIDPNFELVDDTETGSASGTPATETSTGTEAAASTASDTATSEVTAAENASTDANTSNEVAVNENAGTTW